MTQTRRWRLNCTTENIVKYVNSETEPIECPTDSGHTIDTNSIVLVSNNPVTTDNLILVADSTAKKNLMWKKNNYFIHTKTAAIFDDFIGNNINPNWGINVVGSNSSISLTDKAGGQLLLTSGTTANDSAEVTTGCKIFDVDCNPCFIFRVRLDDATQVTVHAGLHIDSDNSIELYYDAAGSATTWQLKNTSGGSSSSSDTGVMGNTNWVVFQLMTDGSTVTVKDKDDAVLTTLNTNIVSGGTMLCGRIKLISKTTTSKKLYIDYIHSYSDREGNPSGSGGSGGCIIL